MEENEEIAVTELVRVVVLTMEDYGESRDCLTSR